MKITPVEKEDLLKMMSVCPDKVCDYIKLLEQAVERKSAIIDLLTNRLKASK